MRYIMHSVVEYSRTHKSYIIKKMAKNSIRTSKSIAKKAATSLKSHATSKTTKQISASALVNRKKNSKK